MDKHDDFFSAVAALHAVEQLDVEALRPLYRVECSGEDFYKQLADRIGDPRAAEARTWITVSRAAECGGASGPTRDTAARTTRRARPARSWPRGRVPLLARKHQVGNRRRVGERVMTDR